MKEVLKTVIMTMAFLAICATSVSALGESCKIGITTDKTQVKGGETVVVTFSTKELNIGNTQGIFAVGGKIQYDKNIFESVVSVEGKNGFEVSGGKITEDGKLSVNKKNGYLTTDGELFTITLKAKSTVTSGETSIVFTDITANTTDTATLKMDPTTFVLRTGNNNVPTTIPTNGTANPTNTIPTAIPTNGTINPTKVQTAQPTSGTINNSGNNIPKTGVDDAIIPGIATAIIMSIIAYIRYRKVK